MSSKRALTPVVPSALKFTLKKYLRNCTEVPPAFSRSEQLGQKAQSEQLGQKVPYSEASDKEPLIPGGLIGKSASRGIGNARTFRSTVIRSDGERLQDQVRDRIRV